MRITIDGFVWLLVTDKAKDIWNSGLFSLYKLYDDDTEALLETFEDLDLALEGGFDIGIEVGHLS